jgi:hypothetical protein
MTEGDTVTNNACRFCIFNAGQGRPQSGKLSYAAVLHSGTTDIELFWKNVCTQETNFVPYLSIWCEKCSRVSVNLYPCSEYISNHALVTAHITHMNKKYSMIEK